MKSDAMQRKWTLSVVGAMAVAVAAVAISMRFAARDNTASYDAAAAADVFKKLRTWHPDGWTVREEPLSDSELGRAMVERTLRYDDATFLIFSKGSQSFGVFVAHWRPGKADLREVNAHTPDTCWLNTGWRVREKRGEFTGFDGQVLQSGQWRCFDQDSGALQYVAFWHLLGGEPVLMWRNGFPQLKFMWRIFWKDLGLLAREQYFIRISSPQPLEAIWRDPAMQGVLEILSPSGLKAGPSS